MTGPAAGCDPALIMIIRHGEKPRSGRPHGINPDGDHDHNSLTVTGWIRAGALAQLFAPSTGDPPRGLRRPDAIYGSAPESGQSKRAIQTVTPLAARLGLEVIRRYAHGHESALAKELVARTGATVVSWHHETIHRIVKHLGPVTPTPPQEWPDDRFDVVWTFTHSDDGWLFEHVPQLLMPDDLPDAIPAERET
jgi:hypothetical protein